MRLVLRQGMAPVWFGLGAGLALSVITASMVVGLVPTEHRLGPGTYCVVFPVVILVAAVAAAIPARYASRINPTVALRCE